MENVKVTLVKSLISWQKGQIATAHCLGLKRPGDFTVQANNACLQGKIKVISHLVKVEAV